MQIDYELTKRDFSEAFTAHRNRSPLRKWLRRSFLVILLLLAVIILAGFLIKPSVQVGKDLAPFFGLVAMWIVILWMWPRWSAERQFVKQPGAQGPRTLLLGAPGAHWTWNGGSSDVEWRNYIRYVEGPNQILFYTSPVCFNILPKRSIAPEQLTEIRTILQQNIRSDK